MLAGCGQAAAPARVPPAAPSAPAASAQAVAEIPTAVPTSAPTAVATIAPTATPSPAALPASKRIGPLVFISQTLNNCGPASVAEVLNFWGVQRSQAQVAAVLRPDLPAYGMSLYGVPFYADSVGMKSFEAVGGTQQLVKAFVANGLPVIISDLVSRSEAIRHFRPIDGYDDAGSYFLGSDPYLGPDHKISYADFDDLWNISNHRFVVIYPPDKQPLVNNIVQGYWNYDQAEQAGLQFAQQRASQQPKLPWGYFELADLQIDHHNLAEAALNIQKGNALGLPFEGHWLQLKLQQQQAIGNGQ